MTGLADCDRRQSRGSYHDLGLQGLDVHDRLKQDERHCMHKTPLDKGRTEVAVHTVVCPALGVGDRMTAEGRDDEFFRMKEKRLIETMAQR